MKTNKQVIDELQEYYLKQDPKVIARALANMMIDMNRIHYLELLSSYEKKALNLELNKILINLINL